jgi:hypothetical protein
MIILCFYIAFGLKLSAFTGKRNIGERERCVWGGVGWGVDPMNVHLQNIHIYNQTKV